MEQHYLRYISVKKALAALAPNLKWVTLVLQAHEYLETSL